jgi:integrase
MSVQRYDTADGVRWRVRWREVNGRMRSRTMTSKREATALDADVRARKFKGEMLPRPGRESLAAAYDEWFRLRGSTLATTTQRTYAAVWDAHVRGRFDHHRLNELAAEPQLFYELTADMRERGVGPAAQRKVLVVISAVLTLAVELKKMPTNPIWRMRKPPGTRQRIPRPFPPVVVERIRLRMARRETKDPSGARASADACLVTLMSYAGLRPGEALALTWADIGSHTIAVDKAVRDGEEGPTKTGAVRGVPLVAPLQSDLDTLRWAYSWPDNHRLVIPASDGGHWTRSELNNWRNRVWNPAVAWLAAADHTLAGLAIARPYDCRGSFVSLHLRAGVSPLEVAKWAGHSPAVMFRHYANVIEELQGEPTISAEEQIARAREAVEEKQKEELDRLVVDLYEHPTVSGSHGLSQENRPHAARVFYEPNK